MKAVVPLMSRLNDSRYADEPIALSVFPFLVLSLTQRKSRFIHRIAGFLYAGLKLDQRPAPRLFHVLHRGAGSGGPGDPAYGLCRRESRDDG